MLTLRNRLYLRLLTVGDFRVTAVCTPSVAGQLGGYPVELVPSFVREFYDPLQRPGPQTSVCCFFGSKGVPDRTATV